MSKAKVLPQSFLNFQGTFKDTEINTLQQREDHPQSTTMLLGNKITAFTIANENKLYKKLALIPNKGTSFLPCQQLEGCLTPQLLFNILSSLSIISNKMQCTLVY